MVDISRLSSSFSLVAPAASNQSYKVLRDLGATASPVSTDLRQQSNDIRQFGNSIINQMQSSTSLEETRGLANSAEISRTVAAAVDAASGRLNMTAARNNQRENDLLKNKSGSGSSSASAVLSLLEANNEDEDGLFSALRGTGGRSQVKKASPLDIIASAIKGPKYGEDIFERGIQPMVGAGNGGEVTINRRALRDEEVQAYVDTDDTDSRSVTVLKAVADGRYTADNDGFIISGKIVNVSTTAVYDTRDPNNEDPRRSSITHNFGSGSDVLFVAGDNDTSSDGGEGDDIMIAEGNSLLRGGAGDDLIAGQTVFGDQGEDILFSSGFASGGDGNDIIGMFQVDPEDPQRLTAYGGEGDDLIVSDDAAAAHGDEGNDSIILRQGGVAVGGEGNDVITSFGAAEIDAGTGDDDIRLGGPGDDFQVGGKIIAGDGDDKVEAYGYVDLNLGKGNDKADLGNGGVVRFTRGDGTDSVTLGDTALPPAGGIRKINTVILGNLMPADVSITVSGFDVTISIPNSLDKLSLRVNSLSEPLNLRFEKNGMMQVVTVQNTLQTTGPLQPLTPFVV